MGRGLHWVRVSCVDVLGRVFQAQGQSKARGPLWQKPRTAGRVEEMMVDRLPEVRGLRASGHREGLRFDPVCSGKPKRI